eukprot:gene12296-13564_t
MNADIKVSNEGVDGCRIGSNSERNGRKRKRTLKENDNYICNVDKDKTKSRRTTSSKRRKVEGGEFQKITTTRKEKSENVTTRKEYNIEDVNCDIDISKGKKDVDGKSEVKCKENWRSRCGRKRKYHGQASARQGATKRERNRFQGMKQALDALKKLIPKAQHPSYGRLSKYATLKLAAKYIAVLTDAVNAFETTKGGKCDAGYESGGSEGPSSASSPQSEESSSRICILEKDELFTGSFEDVMFQDGEGSDDDCLLELAKQSWRLMEEEGIEMFS